MKLKRYKMLTAQQQRIYDALKNIGEALANFYLDGVRMTHPDCTILSKANMIAHAAREIDGGLRDLFAPNKIVKEKKTLIADTVNKDSDHFASILAAVGKDDPQNMLAKKWFAIAGNFHRVAHRKDIHSTSVDPAGIIALWAQYENILDVVVGSFLGITNRLDGLLNLDQPQHEAIPTLKNILKVPQYANYFFFKLDKKSWLLPLINEHFFDPANAPVKVEENTTPGYWYPIRYLLNIAPIVRRNVRDNLIEVVDKIMTQYINDNLELHPNIVYDLLQIIIKVECLSFSGNSKAFFEKYNAKTQGFGWNLVHSSMTKELAEKLVDNKDVDGLMNLMDYFFGFTTVEEPSISFFAEETGPYLRVNPNVEDHHIRELLTRHGKQIVEILGPGVIKLAMEQLRNLVTIGAHALSDGSPASIEPTDQSGYTSDWEVILVYFIRDYASQLETAALSGLIDEMLDSNVQILQRLGIHLIRVHFDQFHDKWWQFMQKEQEDSTIYIHEPYVLLRDHSENFTDEQFEKAIAWIERINVPDTNEDENLAKSTAGYRIRRWLTSLKPAGDKSKALLKEKEQYYLQWDHSPMNDRPEFDSYGTSSIGYDYPLEFEDFQEMSIKEQIEYIQRFTPQHDFDSSEEGLAELLRAAVYEASEKYLYSLDEFIPLHSLYLNGLIGGFTDALRQGKLPDYSLLLSFVEMKLSYDSFKNEPQKRFQPKKSFASSVSEFISVIADNHDRLNLSKEDVERMMDLLLSMINTKEFQEDDTEIQNVYTNHVLNSITGRLYLALIQLVRIWAGAFTKNEDAVKWPESIKEHFTGLLSSSENKDKDFSIILGMELPLLVSFDRKWAEDHLDVILDESNSRHFEYRMHAMFSGYYGMRTTFYEFLKQHHVFSKALNYFKEESRALDNVMIYALLEGKRWKIDPKWERIIAEILARKNPEQLKRLIYAVWQQNLLNDEELIDLWEQLMPLFEELPELSAQYSILLWLFGHLPTLSTKAFDLATAVIQKTTGAGEIYPFLKHVYDIADSNPELAGKLVLQVYTAKLVASFMEPELKNLVEKLYAEGQKDLADNICIQVSEAGSLSLKTLYNEHN